MIDKRQEIYNEIVNRCVAIKNGRFIMSTNAISSLLRYVARNEESIKFLEECNNKYDYRTEFKSAINIIGSSKFFKIPDNPYKAVSLIMGLLYDIDRENINLTAFLKEYFDYGDVDDNYVEFCKQIIIPLQLAYGAMCREERVVIEDIGEDERTKPLTEAIGEQILPYMISLSEMIGSDNNFSSQKRQEYLDILEGMCYAIEQGSTKWLKFMWIAVKNTFMQYKLAASTLNGIRSLLITYGVIAE